MNDDSTDIKLTITAGPWTTTAEGVERRWSGPPPTAEEPGRNLAARIEKRSFWPFHRYDWYVYSPFDNDSVLEGSSLTLEAAKAEADAALRALYAEVK